MKGVTTVITKQDKNQVRKKRHGRVRSKISGTAQRPRLNVFRSNKNIYAQLIDDVAGVTLVSANTQEKVFEGMGSNVEAAAKIGETIAKRAAEKNITTVVFDRSGYLYHGRVKALAEAARENGLEF
nr:50S ribosomal protein L18 [Solibacillus sp. MA9]